MAAGIFTESLVNISNSTVNNNRGGGISTFGGTINLTNSTVSGNFGNSVGGGITIEGDCRISQINRPAAFNCNTAADRVAKVTAYGRN